MKIERKYMAHYLNAAFSSENPSYVRLGADLEEYSPELSANVEKKSNILGQTSVTIDSYQKQGEVSPGPHDPFAEERLGGCAGPGICALSAGRAGGRFAKQYFQCHPRSTGTGSRTADRTAVQWLFQAKPGVPKLPIYCAEMHSRDGQK